MKKRPAPARAKKTPPQKASAGPDNPSPLLKSVYRAVVEDSPAGMLVLGEGSAVVYANPRARQLLSKDKSPLEGKPVESVLDPASLDDFAKHLAEARGGKAMRFDLPMHHPALGQRILGCGLTPLRAPDGQVAGVLAMMRDITDEKALQERMTRNDKLISLGGLLSGIAHDMNNPLTVIWGCVQLMRQETLSDSAKFCVTKIENSTSIARRLVSNLLTYVRGRDTEKKPADPNAVIKGVVELMAYVLRESFVEVELHLQEGLPTATLDMSRLQQLIMNLLQNAVQAIQEAKIRPGRIVISSSKTQDNVVIEVADNGPGIPEAVRAKIFEPFFTTKAQGTGLGLNICYGIVTSVGGRLSVDCPPSGGTVFRVELPVVG